MRRRFSREAAFQLRELGVSYAAIGRRFGVSAGAVWQALNGCSEGGSRVRQGVGEGVAAGRVTCYLPERALVVLRERAVRENVSVSLLCARILLGFEGALVVEDSGDVGG